MGIKEFIVRLLIARVAGIVIGLERQLHPKRAGTITNALVSRGSARFLAVMAVLLISTLTFAQNSRFRPVDFSDSVYHITGKKLIIPAVLAGYGFSQFMIDPVLDLNRTIKDKFVGMVSKPFRIDDFSQFVPAGAVYGLNLLGIKGKHNFLDRSVIIGTSMIIMELSVECVKYLTHIQRPDGSAFNAFPSGHTAIAFASAEFLYQEYKDVSIWYGIAGYTIAAGTGFFRMYNNRHWLTDVVAGAGFGILSTKIAYWVFPKIKKLIFNDIQINFSLIPTYNLPYGAAR